MARKVKYLGPEKSVSKPLDIPGIGIPREVPGSEPYDPQAGYKTVPGMPFVEGYGEKGMELGEEAPIGAAMVGGVLGGPPGAAAGGALGKYLQMVSETGDPLPLNAPEEVAEEALLMGALEGGGSVVGKGVGALLKPAGKLVTNEAARMAEWVKELNLPMTPSSYVKSRLSRGAQWMAELWPTGRLLAQHRRGQLKLALLQMSDDLMKGKTVTDKTSAGINMVEGLQDASGKYFEASQKKFKDLIGQAGGLTADIEMPTTARVAKELLEEHGQGLGKLKSELTKFLGKTKGADAKTTVKAMEDLRKNIWKSTPKDMMYVGGQLTESVLDDLGRWDGIMQTGLAKTVQGAKDLFKVHKVLNGLSKENPTVREIYRAARFDPRRVIINAFRTGNFNDLKQIRNAMIKTGNEDAWKMAETRFFQNILDTATDISKNTGELVFQPQKFLKVWADYQGQIRTLAPTEFWKWDRFAKIIETASPDLMEVQKPAGLGQLLKMSVSTGAGGAAAGGAGIVVPFGFSFVTAQSLSNPRGWMRAWLTTGVLPGADKLVGQAAGKAGQLATAGMKNEGGTALPDPAMWTP